MVKRMVNHGLKAFVVLGTVYSPLIYSLGVCSVWHVAVLCVFLVRLKSLSSTRIERGCFFVQLRAQVGGRPLQRAFSENSE